MFPADMNTILRSMKIARAMEFGALTDAQMGEIDALLERQETSASKAYPTSGGAL